MAFFHHSTFVIAFTVRTGERKLFYLLTYLLTLAVDIHRNFIFICGHGFCLFLFFFSFDVDVTFLLFGRPYERLWYPMSSVVVVVCLSVTFCIVARRHILAKNCLKEQIG